jgi:ABC-2 type transport system ATP-binding protein
MNTTIEARNLTHRFGKKVALNNLNLSISGAGVTALLGTNGAGKTTFINCALGLCKPSSGEISLFGYAPGELKTKRLIGVMLQDSSLPDLLTAREHIELFCTYYRDPLSINEIIQRCDLGSFIDTRYKKLSGGQKRRVQFALAILGRPKIVFLDEPTTGLDIDARKVVWNTISELGASGTTVILTTHYLEEADTLADHTIVMSHGSVIANDSTENIRAQSNGAVISCETSLDTTTIKTLAKVKWVEVIGRKTEINSSDATSSLIDLLRLDPELSNLIVRKTSLEDAFIKLNLSQNQPQPLDNGEAL